jgi:hypothetical protein
MTPVGRLKVLKQIQRENKKPTSRSQRANAEALSATEERYPLVVLAQVLGLDVNVSHRHL